MCYVYFFIITYPILYFFFFFNDTATTEIYTLSLHDALPIFFLQKKLVSIQDLLQAPKALQIDDRSEEHTSELQSQSNLVCRLLLEKKKNKRIKANCTGSNAEHIYA